jgi:hypothetical protein
MQEKYHDDNRINVSHSSTQKASPKDSVRELHGVEPSTQIKAIVVDTKDSTSEQRVTRNALGRERMNEQTM